MSKSNDNDLSLKKLDITGSNNDSNYIGHVGYSAELAGSIYSNNSDLQSTLSSLVPEGGEVYILSSHDSVKEVDGNLRSIVVFDRANKSVTVVTAGTRLGTTYGDMAADTKDDLKLGLGFQPDKKAAVQKLNALILDKLGEEKSNYDFNYVGHSLGAVVSDIAATHMATKLAKQDISLQKKISTITFDNPGSYTLVNKMLKKYKEKLKEKEKSFHKSIVPNDDSEKSRHNVRKKTIDNIKLDDLVDYRSFNNRENFINTNDKQAGKLYTIVPSDQKDRGGFSRMMGWLAEKMPGFIFKKIFKLMSYGSLLEQAKEHGTDNFISVLKDENGKILYHDADKKVEVNILDFLHNTKPLPYNEELFNHLDIKSHFDALPMAESTVLEFSMYDPEKNKRLECSREELVDFLQVPHPDITDDVIKSLAMHLKTDNGYKARPLSNKHVSTGRSK